MARLQKNNNKIEEAISSYEKVISLNPTNKEALFELGSIHYLFTNNIKKAIECFEEVINQEPQNSNVKICLGLCYLKIKNYKKGWEYFEYRLTEGNLLFDIFPLWGGESIKDKTILVYSERGFGDTIMFSRFLPLLKSKCEKILFLPQKELSGIFDEDSLGVEIIGDIREQGFDLHTSIMSLPSKLGIELETDIPKTHKHHFKAKANKSEDYKEKYFQNKDFKVGINWQGCTKIGTERNIPIACFEKIFKIPNISFYSLQTDEGKGQLETLKNFKVTDLGSTFNNFYDTASAIENLDLVISNDTSVANLAGAMGKECWILLPFIQDWRWSEDLSYCLWYENVKLFKQPELNNWDNVFDNVYNELAGYVAKNS